MKLRIASAEAESSRFRNDSASTGLYRFRVDPVGGGLTRSRDGPAARAGCPASGLIRWGGLTRKRYDPLLSGGIRPGVLTDNHCHWKLPSERRRPLRWGDVEQAKCKPRVNQACRSCLSPGSASMFRAERAVRCSSHWSGSYSTWEGGTG